MSEDQGAIKIDGIKEIPIASMSIGTYQARTTNAGEEIEELAESIKRFGLLQPIVVCKSPRDSNKWEVVCGQRRLLAHKKLGESMIRAAFFDRVLSTDEGKAVSANENVFQLPMSRPDLVDMCEEFFKRYGSIQAVVEKTKIPYYWVKKYVRLARLESPLKEMYEANQLSLDLAVKIQDAATHSGKFHPEQAKELWDVLKVSDDPLRKVILETKNTNPQLTAKKAKEAAEQAPETIKVTGTLVGAYVDGIKKLAGEQGGGVGEVGMGLIQEALKQQGYVGEED